MNGLDNMEAISSSLTEIIIQKIRRHGPISFRDFMEMSLYYPGLGYYTSANDKIGKDGDFYTSVWLTAVFGEMVAKQLEEMWTILGKEDFTIVEYGGGNGSLCRDILRQLQHNPELYAKLHYCIIEKKGRTPEHEKLVIPGKLSWHESIQEIPPMTGCILSNELLDNFAINQVMMKDELMEVWVDYKDGFVELLHPASRELKNYLEQLQVNLPKGFRTEISLQAVDWIKDIAGVLQKGFVLTIDYGSPSPDLYNPCRSAGTLVCYHKHTKNYCPYINIGNQDITAHVNFSALYHWGLKNGLQYSGFTNQASFLLGLGLTEHLNKQEQNSKTDPGDKTKKAVMLHTFLADMGRKFKVLIQNKGIQKPRLSGLQFSQLSI
ncbi:MAG: class I SAM-dependent methyltransferase [Chitinophagaceae bacterium]